MRADVAFGSLAADRYAIGDRGMSASRRKRTISRSARQVRLVPEPAVSNRSKSKLFDHLVGVAEQGRGNVDVQCLSGSQVDDQLELGPPQERKVREHGVRRKPSCKTSASVYCRAMLAIRTTLPHFSDSAAMKAANSWALSGIGTVPRSASRASIVGYASTAPISRSRRAMTAAGVPLGAPTPAQVLASYPGNASAIVGTSGSA